MEKIRYLLSLILLLSLSLEAEELSLEQVKEQATPQSKYLTTTSSTAPKSIPKFRIDTLDPDLVNGKDADWWLEVIDVLSNGEMPPPDEDVKITEKNRGLVIDWLSTQVLAASQIERSQAGHSSFRRMTRYELNYALQDLLGVTQNFAIDLLRDRFTPRNCF